MIGFLKPILRLNIDDLHYLMLFLIINIYQVLVKTCSSYHTQHINLFLCLPRITNSQICRQQQRLPTTTREEPDLQRNQSSNVIVTSSTEISSLHNDHINDLIKENQRMASAISNPVQKAMVVRGMCQILRDLIPNVQANHNELVLKGETRLELDIEAQAVTSNRKASPQGSEFHLDLPLNKKPTRKLSHRRSKITTSTTKSLFGTVYLKSVVYENREIKSKNGTHGPHQIEYRFESFFIFHPTNWLVYLGVKRGLDAMVSRSTQGWKHALRTFRAVPEDASIFKFCETGISKGLKLFSREVMPRCGIQTRGGGTITC